MADTWSARSKQSLTRWRFARCVALVAGVSAVLGCSTAEKPTAPNLLLITVDTLRADRLACYGGEPGVGEAMCAIANTGTRVLWAIATAPYTAPSVASILTSAYPTEHGAQQEASSSVREEAVTLAEVLQDHGYSTAAFVSNPVLERSRNLDQGFDVYDQEMTRHERNRPDLEERAAGDTTDAVIAWKNTKPREPWFVWVHYQDPHGPYGPPMADPVVDEEGEAPLEVLENHAGIGGIPAYQEIPGVRSFGAYSRSYINEIHYLDSHIERLIERLDSAGSPPAILLTADHGEAFGEDNFYFAHGHSVGLDQIRVPLLWRPPPLTEATKTRKTPTLNHPVSLVDVAPTLLRAAGIAIPDRFRGQPLRVTGVRARPIHPARPIFSDHPYRAAIIVGRAYYARDRKPLRPDNKDKMTGGRLVPLPKRSARLGDDGVLPVYTDAAPRTPSVLLEPLLEKFIDIKQNPTRLKGTVSDESLRRLRALGYLE